MLKEIIEDYFPTPRGNECSKHELGPKKATICFNSLPFPHLFHYDEKKMILLRNLVSPKEKETCGLVEKVLNISFNHVSW
jgi:hypothetical protein